MNGARSGGWFNRITADLHAARVRTCKNHVSSITGLGYASYAARARAQRAAS